MAKRKATGRERDKLRQQRTRRGWSENDVAIRIYNLGTEHGVPEDQLGVDGRAVGRWELGKTQPNQTYTALLSRLYNLPPKQLDLPPLVLPVASPEYAAPEEVNVAPTLPSITHEEPVNRREFTKGIIGLVGTLGLADDADVSSLAERVNSSAQQSATFLRRAGMRLDGTVLDQIDTEVRLLATRYMSEPPYVLFKPLTRLRDDVLALLDTFQPTPVMSRLYLYAGQLCGLLAQMAIDLNHPEVAETHARMAWSCADLCGHDTLRAYVRWVQGHIAYWRGDYRTSAGCVRSAGSLSIDAMSRQRLASQEARAWAASGDRGPTEQALAQAAAAREGGSTADLVGVFRFPPGKASYYASEAFLSLGDRRDLTRAAAAAEEAIETLQTGPPEDTCREYMAAARLDLVSAHLALRSLDGAQEHLRPVLSLPSEHRTTPIIRRVGKISRTLQTSDVPFSATVRDMLEQAALFSAHPAARTTLDLQAK
jgi:hypothetical protein